VPLPEAYASFLRSFDGVDLFHEAIVVAGVGALAPTRLAELNAPGPVTELVFAEAAGGDRFVFAADGRVIRLRAESEERWVAGSDFARWLDAVVAHDRVLYGADGEFSLDAFEPDGAEVVPIVALRQAERALRADPGGAEAEHERGIALRRLGRWKESAEAFQRSANLDPGNPWPWFDLGRVCLDLDVVGARRALEAFETAGALEVGPTGARLWAWAARAALVCALPERLERARREALLREPNLKDSLVRSRDAALAEQATLAKGAERLEQGLELEAEGQGESAALLDALDGPIPRGKFRLPTVP
jgi:hypothetical protein